MSIIERLTPARRRFFSELGILTDADIPESFFDVIQSYADDFSESEKFCIDDRNISFYSKSFFQ